MDRLGDDSPESIRRRQQRFLQLFLKTERRIYGFILAMIPNIPDADDLLQETSEVLWRKFDEFDPGTDFAAWALTVTRFQVLKFRKVQRREQARLSDQALDALTPVVASLGESTDARREALVQCLAKLSRRDRELVQLRYRSGATTRDVANRVARPLKSVYRALNRIHSQLLICIRRTLAAEASP